MPIAQYRITDLEVEGFRGFTSPQTVQLNGRNLFVFGPNGRGKSSIVEAVRWCLFGAPTGTDIEVRNTFYDKQECRVTLTLSGPNGKLSIHRELRPGHDRSRQSIRDSSGKEVLAREALPQLTRLGPHESTQVIFAAQHAGGRQISADISDFANVLCFYLHLEQVPELLRGLKDLHEQRSVEAEGLSARIEQLEQSYRQELHDLQTKIAAAVEDPPWGDASSPTGSETEEKIRGFVAEISRILDEHIELGRPASELLSEAERCVTACSTRDSSESQPRRDQLATRVQAAEALLLQYKRQEVAMKLKQAEASQLDEKVRQILAGETSASLRSRFEGLDRGHSEREARYQLSQRARDICMTYRIVECPACGVTSEPSGLLEAFQAQSEKHKTTAADAELLDRLRERLKSFEEANADLKHLDAQISGDTRASESSLQQLGRLLEIDESTVDSSSMELQVSQLREDLAKISRHIADRNDETLRMQQRIRALQREQKYHEHRDQAKEIEHKLAEGMNEARDLLKDYRNLLTRIAELRHLAEQSFKTALDKAIPDLEQMFTLVYRRLTEQLSYDVVRIYHDPERVGILELRVASERLPGQDFAVNVLNGQAVKALHLVPYFVFSRFQPEMMELDLLLIDDPSESFDTSHLGLLVQELAEASKHAQLIVASHESEKFEPHLANAFGTEAFLVLNVDAFDPLVGPTLVRT
ncbi:MAG: AAA family ATPase [Candidatus Binataceae bacterium]